MRQLVLMRGGMGAGKSTFIQENNLKQYTLCADDIRLLFQSPALTEHGGETITMNHDREVWRLLKTLLKERMKRGEFTVIDATHSKTRDINQYREMAQKYRYRVTVIDFTDVPIELAKIRNRNRPPYKQVPDEAIENVYSRFETQDVPTWCTAIKPHEFQEKVRYTPTDYSHYKKIHHIGDIHGCYDVLMEYLGDGLKDDELYIFVGDFIDRGLQNAEVVEFLFTIMNKNNVIFLEGNHEHWLFKWANDEVVASKEFNKYTQPQLEEAGIDKKKARMLYRKLQQIVYYTYKTERGFAKVLVSHGGVGHIPDNLLMVATEQFIKGVGDYTTDIDQHFQDNEMEKIEVRGGKGNVLLQTWDNVKHYQIHGHRNIFGHPIRASHNSFNLEGGIERGGNLRAVTLDENGFSGYEVKNNVFDERHIPKKIDDNTTVEELLSLVKDNRYIRENKMPNNISSFNFTPQAFYRGVWNAQTMRARGLFINTNTNEIVARSYDKFFNVGEREETSIAMLKNNLEFPVKVRQKPNGYLGILGYNSETDELVFASKSSTKSEHAKWFKEIFEDSVPEMSVIAVKELLKDGHTMTFEVIDPVNDPHIIKYDKREIILLDIIYNTPSFQKKNYEIVNVWADFMCIFDAKEEITFQNWNSFYDWYDDVTTDITLEEEGYIIEDSNGFMTKLKLPYYNEWKKMRHVQSLLAGGKPVNTGMLITPLQNKFYAFLQTKSREELKLRDIVSLREEYYTNA